MPNSGASYIMYGGGPSQFDDVTSVRTAESYKVSARQHHLLDNHLFSQSQSRESLPLVMANYAPSEIPIESVDG